MHYEDIATDQLHSMYPAIMEEPDEHGKRPGQVGSGNAVRILDMS